MPVAARGAEQKPDEGENQKCVGGVDQEVDEMIAEDVEAAKVKVHREGEKTDGTGAGEIQERFRIPDPGVVEQVSPVVEQKGYGEGVGVDQGGEGGQE